jgi:hypothetical protein
VPDAAGEAALEAADGLAGAFAFAAAAGDVVARLRVTACAGDDHAVKGGVDLAVAALVEALALCVARACRDWRDARGARELAGVAKRCAPAISPTSLAAISGPKPGSVSSCGAICSTSSVISRSRVAG